MNMWLSKQLLMKHWYINIILAVQSFCTGSKKIDNQLDQLLLGVIIWNHGWISRSESQHLLQLFVIHSVLLVKTYFSWSSRFLPELFAVAGLAMPLFLYVSYTSWWSFGAKGCNLLLTMQINWLSVTSQNKATMYM